MSLHKGEKNQSKKKRGVVSFLRKDSGITFVSPVQFYKMEEENFWVVG